MLLQGNRTAERPGHAVPARREQISVRPDQPREAAPQPPAPVARRTYPPITWATPSLGRAIADGLGGAGRAAALLMVSIAVLIGAAMAVAIVLAGIVQVLGFDVSAAY